VGELGYSSRTRGWQREKLEKKSGRGYKRVTVGGHKGKVRGLQAKHTGGVLTGKGKKGEKRNYGGVCF